MCTACQGHFLRVCPSIMLGFVGITNNKLTHHPVAKRDCNDRFIIVGYDAFILTLFMLIVLPLLIFSSQVAAVPHVSHLSTK